MTPTHKIKSDLDYMPSNQPKATAPDYYRNKGNSAGQFMIADQNDPRGQTVALVYTNEADADLIIRAVNSHAALVEALQEMDDQFAHYCEYNEQDENETKALEKCREALRLERAS